MNGKEVGYLPDVAQQVKAAREELDKLVADDKWRESMPQWVGRLGTRLRLLCDAVEAGR